jgi:integrase
VATIVIVTRKTRKGNRYQVRYRLGGRAYPLLHAGVFDTQKEAKQRRDLVAGEIAHGRNPQLLLDQLLTPTTPSRTFMTIAVEYKASRIDAAPSTLDAMDTALNNLLPTFGALVPERITTQMVQAWITTSSETLRPGTIRQYLKTLRGVLDYAEIEPNPARHRSIRLPRQEKQIIQPPSSAELRQLLDHVGTRWALPIRILCATGLRVSELAGVTWADVDLTESRFRIQGGKTRAARRWAPIRPDLLMLILDETPPDARTATARVFPGVSEDALRKAMWRACQSAGIASYSPHDLRHRWVSVQLRRGVPIIDVQAAAGHTDASMTLGVYGHVLVDTDDI